MIDDDLDDPQMMLATIAIARMACTLPMTADTETRFRAINGGSKE